ncbi:MAG: hypothetical protein PUF51_01830 [Bifidobacteriaceae bacterium]|nr:hypothetical protein [Bifidobacteriaceae bacterium]
MTSTPQIHVSTDGSFLPGSRPVTGWAWVDHTTGLHDCGGSLGGNIQLGELCAVLQALRSHPGTEELVIESDSRAAIEYATKRESTWSQTGWVKDNGNPAPYFVSVIRAIHMEMEEREGPISFVWVKGHQGDEFNEQADQFARGYATMCRDFHAPSKIPAEAQVDLMRVPLQLAGRVIQTGTDDMMQALDPSNSAAAKADASRAAMAAANTVGVGGVVAEVTGGAGVVLAGAMAGAMVGAIAGGATGAAGGVTDAKNGKKSGGKDTKNHKNSNDSKDSSKRTANPGAAQYSDAAQSNDAAQTGNQPGKQKANRAASQGAAPPVQVAQAVPAAEKPEAGNHMDRSNGPASRKPRHAAGNGESTAPIADSSATNSRGIADSRGITDNAQPADSNRAEHAAQSDEDQWSGAEQAQMLHDLTARLRKAAHAQQDAAEHYAKAAGIPPSARIPDAEGTLNKAAKRQEDLARAVRELIESLI